MTTSARTIEIHVVAHLADPRRHCYTIPADLGITASGNPRGLHAEEGSVAQSVISEILAHPQILELIVVPSRHGTITDFDLIVSVPFLNEVDQYIATCFALLGAVTLHQMRATYMHFPLPVEP